jgi:hypothetical protein
MILLCSDCTFSGVGVMYVWWCVVKVGILGGNEVFNIMQCFIIHFVKTWFETHAGKMFVRKLVGSKEFFLCAILDGNGDKMLASQT